MFVRVCAYFPFWARGCLNQHHWLAGRMRERRIRFHQQGHGFLRCSDPPGLQELADSFTAHDLVQCAQKWLAGFTPFFTDRERRRAGGQHRLFFSQAEYCDNLIFHRRAALDAMQERRLDANRSIGRPDRLTVIFGRKITRFHKGKLQTVIEDLGLARPVMRSHYQSGVAKQYVRDHANLPTEPASHNIFRDYGIPPAVENLPRLRSQQGQMIDAYWGVQQDILETFVDRGELRLRSQPTVLPNGKRIPGLRLDQPRQMAVMQALVRFSHVAAGCTFTTRELHGPAAQALARSTQEYQTGIAALRSVEVACERLAGKSAAFPPQSGVTSVENKYKILVSASITDYAFSGTAPRKSGPCGAAEVRSRGSQKPEWR